MTSVDNDKVVTLGSLFAQDSPHAYILPERPSTFNHKATFVNDVRYVIHDYLTNMSADHRYLKAMSACTVAGNELPILLTRDVNCLVKEHWSKWLPFCPTPDIRIFDQEDTGEKPFIVNFPFQSFPAKRHAVHPDIHYKLSSKARIPEMGAPCPRYMSRDNYTLPCMIKSTQGVAGRGVFLAQTEDEARAAFDELKNNFGCEEPVITEVIENILEFLHVNFYLFKNGDFKWLGVRRRRYSDLLTPDINWYEQPELRKKAMEVTLPVIKYLYKNNYFGFIGLEILINNKGKFLIDVNPKTSDSTYMLLLAPHLAAIDFPVCRKIGLMHKSVERLIETIDRLNNEEQGRIIVLSADEYLTGEPMKAWVAVFAKNFEIAFRLHRKLLNLCSATSNDA